MSEARRPPDEVLRSYRWWMTAVMLDLAALVALVALGAELAGLYGSSEGRPTIVIAGELLALLGLALVAQQMRDGQEWARTILGAASLPIVAYLVLDGIGPVARGVSMVNLTRIGVSVTRWSAVAAVVAAVVLMYLPAARAHFEQPRR